MEDGNKREVYSSTDIKIERIEKPDKSDEWDVVSEYEVGTYPTPCISVPRIREMEEANIRDAYKTSIKCDLHDIREISSKLQEQENEKIRIEIAEAMLEPSSPDEQVQEIKKQRIKMEEAMQELTSQYKQMLENERVRREMAEVMLEPSSPAEQVQEIQKLRIKMEDAMQELTSQYKQIVENERVRREMEEAMREVPPKDVQKQVNKNIVAEIEEDMQNRSPRYEQEQGKESLPSRGQHSKTKSGIKSLSENNATTKQFTLPMKGLEATLQEQSDEMINLEINDSLQNSTVTSSAARFSKSQDRTAECESVSKVKEDNECQVVRRGDSRAFEELCKNEGKWWR